MREQHLIRRVGKLIEEYNFDRPFANYLKEHFRNHPEMGARDRRETREWSFTYFRIGDNLSDLSFESRLACACFLCIEEISPSLKFLLENHSPFDAMDVARPLEEKIKIIESKYSGFHLEKIFPMREHLSPEIDLKNWCKSFLKKPRVWIRIKSRQKQNVIDELKSQSVLYEDDENPLTLSFKPEVALEKTKSFLKGYFEIQDKSSQRVKDYLGPKENEFWWDACAGSGGKSLVLIEEQPSVNLFATDIRQSILENYDQRLKKSGYNSFETMICDLSAKKSLPIDKIFDGIIADVPCSGSGTWARSPEWLLKNISPDLTKHFVPLQRSIVSNVLPSLRAGSPFVYITCSVFKEENEENVKYFLNHLPLILEKTAYLEGYESGSDTLFVARFSKKF